MPSNNQPITERKNEFMWIEDEDILCSVPKEKLEVLTREEVQEQIDEWEKTHGNKKLKMITVVNPTAKSTKEDRDFVAEVFPKYISALAVINHTALGRMAINLFIGLRPPSYPLKVFKDGDEARKWLKSLK